jgi:hypothetical protein
VEVDDVLEDVFAVSRPRQAQLRPPRPRRRGAHLCVPRLRRLRRAPPRPPRPRRPRRAALRPPWLCGLARSSALTPSSSTMARPSASAVALHLVLATVPRTAACSSAPSGAPSMACPSAPAMVLPTLVATAPSTSCASTAAVTSVLHGSGSGKKHGVRDILIVLSFRICSSSSTSCSTEYRGSNCHQHVHQVLDALLRH